MSVFVLAQMESWGDFDHYTYKVCVCVCVATSIGRIDVNDETMRKFFHNGDYHFITV